MKVSELLNVLQELNPDLEVYMEDWNEQYKPPAKVEYVLEYTNIRTLDGIKSCVVFE